MSSPTESMAVPPSMPPAPTVASPQVPTLRPEDIPNIDDVVIQDDEPVDNVFVEKQQRLLTEPLYTSWSGPGPGRSFRAFANVGLFFAVKQPPVVPDVMLALDVPASADLSKKENRSYFLWIIGKRPDVVIEIVSDRRGGEESEKKATYAKLGVPYCVVFDPEQHLNQQVLSIYGLQRARYQALESGWLEETELGLQIWEGEYEGHRDHWLRWCDRDGRVIPTGRERVEAQQSHADAERRRAETEHERAQVEQRNKEQAEARAQRLAEQLRAHGIEPAE